MKLKLSLKRSLGAASAAVLIAAGAAACAVPHPARSPEETLSLAAAGLAGMDSYHFQMRRKIGSDSGLPSVQDAYEGEVNGHSNLSVRRLDGVRQTNVKPGKAASWSPAGRLAEIERLDKTVEYAASNGKNGFITLHVRLEDNAAEADAAARYRRIFEETAASAARTIAADASAAPNSALEQAVADEIARSRVELNRLLETLRIETDVTIEIDRKSMLPVRIDERSLMCYVAGGKDRSETKETTVSITGFDGRPQSVRASEGETW